MSLCNHEMGHGLLEAGQSLTGPWEGSPSVGAGAMAAEGSSSAGFLIVHSGLAPHALPEWCYTPQAPDGNATHSILAL